MIDLHKKPTLVESEIRAAQIKVAAMKSHPANNAGTAKECKQAKKRGSCYNPDMSFAGCNLCEVELFLLNRQHTKVLAIQANLSKEARLALLAK